MHDWGTASNPTSTEHLTRREINDGNVPMHSQMEKSFKHGYVHACNGEDRLETGLL